ncbi:MAG: LysE family translocator [Alphaproteobacteria bacterium]|nr:LysE family translocator [Alphaproteobacteria bacterium]
MGPEHLIAFNLALLAAMASPGPALLLAIKNTLTGGRAAGIATGLGLGLVASLWTLAALLGLDGLFTLFPWAYTTVKVAGAIYLLYIAWKTWAGARAPLPESPDAARRAFLSGALVNILNPKSVLFAAAVLVVIFPQGLSLTQKLAIAGNHLLVEIIVYSLFATALSRGPVRRAYLGAKPGIDRVTALILGGLGARLLTDR